MTDVEIKPSRFGAPAARQLIDAAQADLAERYGSGDESPIEPVEFDPPEGLFLVAWREGEPVACGGWRTLGHARHGMDGVPENVAEIKRMYAVPSARGTGAALAVLRALESSARAAGMRQMWLETGDRQPEAIAFYMKNGYQRIADYGHYKEYGGVASFGRDL